MYNKQKQLHTVSALRVNKRGEILFFPRQFRLDRTPLNTVTSSSQVSFTSHRGD